MGSYRKQCPAGIGVKKDMTAASECPAPAGAKSGIWREEKKRFVLAAEPIFAVSSVTRGIDFNTTLSRYSGDGGGGGEPKKPTDGGRKERD